MKKIFNSLKIIGIAAVLAVGVSYVSAFTRIPNTPVDNPSENTPEFVTVGGPLATFQTKLGALSTESFFKTGSATTTGSTGWIIAANNAAAADRGGVTSLWQFFQKEYLPGTKSQMKVGSALPARSASPLPSIDKTKFNPNDTTIPLTIDLKDRGTGNNSAAGTQVMNLLASNSCNTTSTIQTNTAGVQFWSTKNSSNADVIASRIQIGDATAGAMKVLVATDTNGNAEWGTMNIVNGQLVVDYPSKNTGNNIVKYGQLCDTPPAITYTWSTGNWGACVSLSSNDWVDFYPSASNGRTWGSLNQSCSSWLAANSGRYTSGTQTRDVVCKDSSGNTVSDTLCADPKPISTQACTLSLQYRVKVTNTSMLGQQTINYTDPGTCLYDKLSDPSTTDPLGNLFPLDCQVRTTSQSVPSGYNPGSYCSLLNFTGGPGYGFNAGNPGGFTVSGSGSWQMQVKPR